MNAVEGSGFSRIPGARPSSRSAEPQSKLITAASHLIDETQQWTWSIREICDEAQLPYNSFYRSFRHKHALVDALSASWRQELERFIGPASEPECFARHVQWLLMKRRRVRFLAIEIGVYQGCNVSMADMGLLLPSRSRLVELLVAGGVSTTDAHRRAMASLLFLVGYLTGVDALRPTWALECEFDPSPPVTSQIDDDADAARATELTWVLENLGHLAVDNRAALTSG